MCSYLVLCVKPLLMSIILKSFNSKLLQFYVSLLINFFKSKGSALIKVVFLTVKKKKWSVIKSPHVHSKSKDQFEMRVYSRLLIINSLNINNLFYLESILKKGFSRGLSLSFKYNN